jgi:hypothetical protein
MDSWPAQICRGWSRTARSPGPGPSTRPGPRSCWSPGTPGASSRSAASSVRRSAKLFDVASHPDITYTVDGVQPASEGVRVTGSLTVRGRTRPLPFDAKVTATADEVRLAAEVPVNRGDFGLMYSPMRMASLINTITIRAVFTRQ